LFIGAAALASLYRATPVCYQHTAKAYSVVRQQAVFMPGRLPPVASLPSHVPLSSARQTFVQRSPNGSLSFYRKSETTKAPPSPAATRQPRYFIAARSFASRVIFSHVICTLNMKNPKACLSRNRTEQHHAVVTKNHWLHLTMREVESERDPAN